jgi:acyl carrier protein
METNHVLDLIGELTARHCEERGLPKVAVQDATVLMGDATGLDSLDLATMIFDLQQATGDDPFAEGFIEFTTAGELARLFGAGASVQ